VSSPQGPTFVLGGVTKHAQVPTHLLDTGRISGARCDTESVELEVNIPGIFTRMFVQRFTKAMQVMTDRFAIADNNSNPCDTSARQYCGGSWKGITSHLDYIQSLGFDAIWISPVVENLEGETAYGEAYHG